MDEAAVVELLVASVAAVVVLAAGAKRVGIGGAEVHLGASIPPLAPGVEGLALGAGIGEGGAIPCARVDDIGGAEVVFENGAELDGSAKRGADAAGVNPEARECVAVKRPGDLRSAGGGGLGAAVKG